jgi:hypothetical protein
MAEPSDFLTVASIATFSGSTAAVVLVANTIRMAVGRNWRLIPFFVSMGISYFVVALTGGQPWYGWVLAAINGCVLYCAAFGIQVSLVEIKQGEPVGGEKVHGRQKVDWLSYWGSGRPT